MDLVRILARGYVLFPGNIIEKGYAYIEDGVLVDLGREPPPPDARYADLVVGGRGRIITPGIVVAHVHPVLYPFRLGIRSVLDIWRTYEELSGLLNCEAAYSASLLAFSDMALRGVSTLAFQDPYPECVLRAAGEIGVRTVYQAPVDCPGGPYTPAPRESIPVTCTGVGIEGMHYIHPPASGDEGIVKLASPGMGDVYVVLPWARRIPRGPVSIGVAAWRSYDPRSVALTPAWSDPWRAFNALFERRGVGLEAYSVPGPGDVAVYRASAPQPRSPEAYMAALMDGSARLETLIVGGEVVIDGGELMTVEREKLVEAASSLERLVPAAEERGEMQSP